MRLCNSRSFHKSLPVFYQAVLYHAHLILIWMNSFSVLQQTHHQLDIRRLVHNHQGRLYLMDCLKVLSQMLCVPVVLGLSLDKSHQDALRHLHRHLPYLIIAVISLE